MHHLLSNLVLLLSVLGSSTSLPTQHNNNSTTLNYNSTALNNHNTTLMQTEPWGNFSIQSAQKSKKTAKMGHCVAARKATIDVPMRTRILEKMYQYKGEDWQGVELPGKIPRHHYYIKYQWQSSEECYNHCTGQCLMPAASYGFDAVWCQLNTDGIGGNRCDLGYTPDYGHQCHGEGSKACLMQSGGFMERFDMAYQLRGADGKLLLDLEYPYDTDRSSFWYLNGENNANWEWMKTTGEGGGGGPLPQWSPKVKWRPGKGY